MQKLKQNLHIKTVHEGVKPFKCAISETRFTEKPEVLWVHDCEICNATKVKFSQKGKPASGS